jgi:positive regulator of sigma E activity
MSKELDDIKHGGRISKISDNIIEVSILSMSACSACHAKGMCSVSDMEEKIVEVRNPKDADYEVGESVIVSMKKSSGNHAVMLGYFIPFLILVISIFTLSKILNDEGMAALISLGLLVPYYIILYIRKEKLKKKFAFFISKSKGQ